MDLAQDFEIFSSDFGKDATLRSINVSIDAETGEKTEEKTETEFVVVPSSISSSELQLFPSFIDQETIAFHCPDDIAIKKGDVIILEDIEYQIFFSKKIAGMQKFFCFRSV